MEIIIAIVVFGFALWWVFLRTPTDTTPSAPYKVETPPTPAPVPAYDVVPPTVLVEGAGLVEVISSAPAASAAPVAEKKPRKPRAPKAVVTEKPAAKKAAPVKKAAVKKPAARTVKSKKI